MDELIEEHCLTIVEAVRSGEINAARAEAMKLLHLFPNPPLPRLETIVMAEGPERINYVLTLACGHKRTWTSRPTDANTYVGTTIYCPICGGNNA